MDVHASTAPITQDASIAEDTRTPQDAAIFHLPLELLTRIFLIVIELDPPGSIPTHSRRRASFATDLRPPARARRNTLLMPPLPSPLGWIASVTHVCRYWRSAALAYPALWDTIPLALGPQWARTALERADAQTELVIRHSFYPGTSVSAFLTQTNFIPDALHRIRVLDLGGQPDTVSTALRRLDGAAPLLQILSIQTDRAVGVHEGWPLTLPQGLFGGRNLPSLRELSFDNCLPFTPEYNLRNLRLFSLCLRLPKRTHVGMTDVLLLLRNMRELETLTLKHCLSDDAIDGETSLDLPALKRIELVDTHSSISRFLRLVSIPDSASLDVQCSMASGAEDESSIGLEIIRPCVARVKQARSIIFSSDGRGLQIDVSSPASMEWSNAYIFLVHSGAGQWDCPRIVRETFAAVEPEDVEKIDLRFSGAAFREETAWKSLPDVWSAGLRRFVNVRFVHTSRTLGWGVCSALAEDRGAEVPLFPFLETLTLVDVDFYSPMFLDGILASLVRARRGVLRKVRLIGCEFRETLIPELRSMVDVEILSEDSNTTDL